MDTGKVTMNIKQRRLILVGLTLIPLFLSGYFFGVAWITTAIICFLISSFFGNKLDKLQKKIEDSNFKQKI